MFRLLKQFKPVMLCFSIITFLLIGYAVSGGPLHEAAKKGNLDEVKHLIEEGVNVDIRDENNDTPLISKGANVNSVDKKCRTPLDLANYSHHKDLAELLIKHGGETRSPWTGSPTGRLL